MCIVFYGLNMIWLLVFLAGVAGVQRKKKNKKKKMKKILVLRQRDLSPGGVVDVLCRVEIGR